MEAAALLRRITAAPASPALPLLRVLWDLRPGALGLALACAHSFVMTVSFSDTLNCILKEEKY